MKKSERLALAQMEALIKTPKKVKNNSNVQEKLEEATKDLVRKKVKKKVAKKVEPEEKKPKSDKRVRIFRNLDYDNATRLEAKKHRDQVRLKVFKIVGPYAAKRRANALKKDARNVAFESFKELYTQEYLLSLDRVDEVFRGGNDNMNDMGLFLVDFKAYLGQK